MDDLGMAQDHIGYGRLVENALRQVVREALLHARREGLPDPHHFYITFRTDYPGVQVSERLRQRHPGEMTIVLQHQFSDLEVDEHGFGVTLSFGGVPERLEVPFVAVRMFADPSIEFGLQFQAQETEEQTEEGPPHEPEETSPDEPEAESDQDGAEIVALDRFRKK